MTNIYGKYFCHEESNLSQLSTYKMDKKKKKDFCWNF